MIYICVANADRKAANDWVRQYLNPSAGETFISNREDSGSRKKYCLVAIPDNGSTYSELMKAHFSYSDICEGGLGSKKLGLLPAEKLAKQGRVKPSDLGASKDANGDFISALVDPG